MLAFADDIALVASNPRDLQLLISGFEEFCKNNNLCINTQKTECMHVNGTGNIVCAGTVLKNVSKFKYLGILISNSSSKPDIIMQDRIQKAKQAFNCIRANVRMLHLNNARVRM
jgi:hypothetical protein